MPIRRCSDQPSKTLVEFYSELTKNPNTVLDISIGNSMLEFIDLINQIFNETEIWGLTSLNHLKLLAKDSWKSDWLISVTSIGNYEYYFEYLIPEEQRPWEYATVKGTAKSLDEAKKYLLISMSNCKGWTTSEELLRLTAK